MKGDLIQLLLSYLIVWQDVTARVSKNQTLHSGKFFECLFIYTLFLRLIFLFKNQFWHFFQLQVNKAGSATSEPFLRKHAFHASVSIFCFLQNLEHSALREFRSI